MDSSRLQSEIVGTSVESGKAMGSAIKENKDEGTAELFKLNQVYYRAPPTLSLVSKRTITRCNFQQLSYPAPLSQQIATAVFNTGEFQVNGKTSYLVIQAGINKGAPSLANIFNSTGLKTADAIALQRSCTHAFLGQGGILNLIEEATFVSASGTEVDRQQNKGLQASHVTRNRMSQDWYNTCGEIQGYPGGSFQDCYDNLGYPGSVEVDEAAGTAASPYVIPTRGVVRPDNSTVYINSIISTGTSNTNSNPVTSTVLDSYYNTTSKPFGPTYTGSVDISYDPVHNATYNPNPGNALTFFVPLSEVLGMFNPYMNALIPSQMLAGGRLELRFKDPLESLIATGAGFSDVKATFTEQQPALNNSITFLQALEINNIYLLLDSFQLNEGTLRRLNEAAVGAEGLSLMFDTWDNTQTTVTGTTWEAQVSQARSRILRSFCVIRDSAMRVNPFGNSLASEAAVQRPYAYSKNYNPTFGTDRLPLMVKSYQAVLGSLYFPQQPLTSLEEYVMNSYYTFSRNYVDSTETNAVSLSEFMGATGNGMFLAGAIVTPASTINSDDEVTDQARGAAKIGIPPWSINWGSATYGFLAERSQLLQLSGLPISNARLLRHQFTVNYAPAGGVNRLVDVFTEYTRMAKVFLGGRVVMRE